MHSSMMYTPVDDVNASNQSGQNQLKRPKNRRLGKLHGKEDSDPSEGRRLSEEEILLQWTGGPSVSNREKLPTKQPDKDRSADWHRRRILKKLLKQNSSISFNDTYLALDCEMVGTGPNGDVSAVGKVCLVNWVGNVVLHTFVKVPERVTDFRTKISGIKAKDIASRDAMCLEDCRALVQHLLRGRILIGHALDNDLKALRIKHPLQGIRDSAIYPPFMRKTITENSNTPILRPRKLRDLAWDYLGKNIQVHGKAHSPIEDATAALELYKLFKSEWDSNIEWQMQSIQSLYLPISDTETDTYSAIKSKNGSENSNVFHPASHFVVENSSLESVNS